jgi:hypothetical protein
MNGCTIGSHVMLYCSAYFISFSLHRCLDTFFFFWGFILLQMITFIFLIEYNENKSDKIPNIIGFYYF